MRRVLAVGLMTVALLATSAAGPAFACGCGGVVDPTDSTVEASNERAIVSWTGKRETIELTFDINSDTPSLGLIVPTPNPATITAGDLRTFDVVESVIQPEVVVKKDWWGLNYFVPDPVPVVADNTPRVPLGPIDATTIAASDTVSLQAWLTLNGFIMSDDMAKAIKTYSEYGWVFTLVSLKSEDVIDGHIDPIRLSFDTNRLVYPMRLARSEKSRQDVRLFVFDDHRNDVTQAAAPTLDIDADIEDLYAGKVQDSRLTPLGSYLSAFHLTYDNPVEQVTSDVGFFESDSDESVSTTVTEYRSVSLLGIPVGTLIVAWALFGLVLVVAYVRRRRKYR